MNNLLFKKYVDNRNHLVINFLGIKVKIKLPPPEQKSKSITSNTNQILQYIQRITPRPYMNFLEIHISEHCNLNCQCCTHFSPLADPEFTNIEEFTNDIKRMSELTQDIQHIHILGGEPLLNPDCMKYLEITRKYFPNNDIRLITNGILLLSQPDEFYEGLSRNNITLAPTKYDQLQLDYEKILEKCNKFNVQFKFYLEKPIKYTYKFPLDLTGSQEPRNSFIRCNHANACFQLLKGRVYTCCFPAYIRHFNKFFNKNLEVTENDSIDIYKAKNIQEIMDFLAKPIPFCRYCDTLKREYQIPWKITTKNIEEWVSKLD